MPYSLYIMIYPLFPAGNGLMCSVPVMWKWKYQLPASGQVVEVEQFKFILPTCNLSISNISTLED